MEMRNDQTATPSERTSAVVPASERETGTGPARNGPQRQGAPSEPVLSFEESLAQTRQIVSELEAGSLGLETSLARFEDGIRLLRRCYEILNRAEQRIQIVVSHSATGEIETKPYAAEASFDASLPADPFREPVTPVYPEVRRRRAEPVAVGADAVSGTVAGAEASATSRATPEPSTAAVPIPSVYANTDSASTKSPETPRTPAVTERPRRRRREEPPAHTEDDHPSLF